MSLPLSGEIIELTKNASLSSSFGRKARNLHTMIHNNHSVPQAFSIIMKNLKYMIGELFENKDLLDNFAFINNIKTRIDPILLCDITNILHQFKVNDPYASAILRSSAYAEDRNDMSFAGIYTSEFIPCEITKIELSYLLAKLLCAPLHYSTEKYLEKTDFHTTDKNIYDISLILQKVVNGSPSGVMFTQEPLLRKNKIIIESTFGLNTTITSGKITPDYYEIDKSDGHIIKNELGSKKIIAKIINGQFHENEMPVAYRNKYSLTIAHINSLYKCAIELDNIFNIGQDVEWIFENEKLYILQSRSIVRKNDLYE